jgi:DNA-directed RNA polymerase specialized sigma24 family protein
VESIKEIYETYERYIFRYLYGLTLDHYKSEKQREVLWLRDFQELSYEEIASITWRSISWVKVNIHRARHQLGGDFYLKIL